MAITYVGGQTAGRTNPSAALQVTFALTGGSASVPAANDLVIVTAVTGSAAGNPAMAVTTPTGYTALGQLNQSAVTADTSMNVSYKIQPGTPETTVDIPGTTNNAWGEAYTIQVFRGANPGVPMDVTAVSAGGTATGRPDPAAITPSTAGAWILVCGGGAAGTGANYVAPADFNTGTDFITATGTDTTDAMVGSGYWDGWVSGAKNPDAYTGGTTGANDSWTAYTIAIRPSAPVSVTPGIATLTLTTFAPTVLTPRVVTPGIATLTLTRFAPTVSVGGGSQVVTPGFVALTLTTFAPVVTASNHQTVIPGVATLTTTRFAPTITTTNHQLVIPGTLALSLTRFVPVVTVGDEGVRTVLVRARNMVVGT